jgi:hypothetical protein
MRKPLILLAVLLAGGALCAQQPPAGSAAPAPAEPRAAAPGQAVSLSLSRPARRGDVYTLSVDSDIHQEGRMSADGINEMGGAQDLSFAFAGRVRVMDVTAAGEPSVLVIKVESARLLKKEGAADPMKVEGAELGVSFPQGKSHFVRRDGQDIGKEEAAILGQIFQPPTGIDEDKLLSPGRPVAVGESWPLDKGMLMAEFKGGLPEGVSLTVDSVDGRATFLGIEPWNGAPCQRISADYTLKTGDIGRFIGEGLTKIHQELWVPVDPGLKASRLTYQVSSTLRGKLRTEENRLIDIRSQNTVKSTVEIKGS